MIDSAQWQKELERDIGVETSVQLSTTTAY
jgi:hypothetical protein